MRTPPLNLRAGGYAQGARAPSATLRLQAGWVTTGPTASQRRLSLSNGGLHRLEDEPGARCVAVRRRVQQVLGEQRRVGGLDQCRPRHRGDVAVVGCTPLDLLV